MPSAAAVAAVDIQPNNTFQPISQQYIILKKFKICFRFLNLIKWVKIDFIVFLHFKNSDFGLLKCGGFKSVVSEIQRQFNSYALIVV